MSKFEPAALAAKLKHFWNHPPTPDRHMCLKEILCLGGSAAGVSMIVSIVSSMITASKISEVYQISVLHGPYICLIASLLGLIIQPFFGKLLQNTSTKWGRYKPYILFIAPIFAAFAIAATWQPQNLGETQRVIFAYLICIPTLVIWNLFNNTFQMMPGVVTPNQQERTDIWAPIGLLVGFSPTVMNIIIGPIRSHFLERGQEYLAFRYIGFICALLGIALVMLLLRVKERVILTNDNQQDVGVIEGLKMIMKNKPLLIFTLALVLGSMRTIVEYDAEVIGKLRYATTIGDGLKVYSFLTAVTGFAVTPNMILLPFLTRKFNNRTVLMFWVSLNAIAYAVLGFVGVQNIPQGTVSAVVLTALRFIALFNATVQLQPLMLSEISDYQQYKTGKRLEGFIQMFAYTLVLVFTNVGLVVMAYVKQAMGYEPKNYFNVNTVSDELMDVATRYFNIAFLVSAGSAALMFLALIFYNLSKKEHARIMEELKLRSIAENGITEETADLSDTVENNDKAAEMLQNMQQEDAEDPKTAETLPEEEESLSGSAEDTDDLKL